MVVPSSRLSVSSNSGSRPPTSDQDRPWARRTAGSGGSVTMARAIPTRCSCPPESCRGWCRARSVRPTTLSAIAARARRWHADSQRERVSQFDVALGGQHRQQVVELEHEPDMTGAASAPAVHPTAGRSARRPPRLRPALGVSRPPIMLSSVVFPDPDGPIGRGSRPGARRGSPPATPRCARRRAGSASDVGHTTSGSEVVGHRLVAAVGQDARIDQRARGKVRRRRDDDALAGPQAGHDLDPRAVDPARCLTARRSTVFPVTTNTNVWPSTRASADCGTSATGWAGPGSPSSSRRNVTLIPCRARMRESARRRRCAPGPWPSGGRRSEPS